MRRSGAGGIGAAEAAVMDGGEVAELELLTRALIGITCARKEAAAPPQSASLVPAKSLVTYESWLAWAADS